MQPVAISYVSLTTPPFLQNPPGKKKKDRKKRGRWWLASGKFGPAMSARDCRILRGRMVSSSCQARNSPGGEERTVNNEVVARLLEHARQEVVFSLSQRRSFRGGWCGGNRRTSWWCRDCCTMRGRTLSLCVRGRNFRGGGAFFEAVGRREQVNKELLPRLSHHARKDDVVGSAAAQYSKWWGD